MELHASPAILPKESSDNKSNIITDNHGMFETSTISLLTIAAFPLRLYNMLEEEEINIFSKIRLDI